MIRLISRASQTRRERTKAREPTTSPRPSAASVRPRARASTGSEVVEVTHLTKVYGRVRAVDDVSFSVRGGEVFSFLGPNGAGKSTTVEILEGLRRPSAGETHVLGFDPWTQLDQLKRRIGVIPQDFHFFPKLTPR